MAWNRTWGGNNIDVAYDVWGYESSVYTVGHTKSYGYDASKYDFALVKWDTAGNVAWNHTWGGIEDDSGFGIWGDSTDLFTVGFTNSFSMSNYDLALVKWDTAGNVVWNRTWGGTGEDVGYEIWGYGTFIYTAGYTNSFGAGGYDAALVKWDTAGNVVWNRTWGGSGSWDLASGIWGDGTFIYTAGYTNSFGAGGYDAALVKWDTAGNVVWNRTWGGSSTDGFESAWGDATSIYTLGWTASYGAGTDDFALIEWDTAGNVVWNRTWGGINVDDGSDVWGNGSSIYAVGYSSSFGAGGTDGALTEWDTAGNLVWNRTWGGSGNDRVYSIWGNQTTLFTVGETTSFGAGFTDFLIVKWGGDETSPTNTGFEWWIVALIIGAAVAGGVAVWMVIRRRKGTGNPSVKSGTAFP